MSLTYIGVFDFRKNLSYYDSEMPNKPTYPKFHVPSFIGAAIVFIIIASLLFGTYYLLIARPKIKADCLNAATTNVILDGDAEGVFNPELHINKGEEVRFNQYLYAECLKIF